METVDDEILSDALKFADKAKTDGKPADAKQAKPDGATAKADTDGGA